MAVESMETFLKNKVGAPHSQRSGVVIEDTATLEAYQLYVKARTVAANGAFTLTAPPPELCEGSILVVYMTARNGTDDITLAGIEGGNQTLNLAGDFSISLSVGDRWLPVATPA